MAPGIRLRAETDFAGDHGGAQGAFGEVVLGGYPPVLGPVLEPVAGSPEDVLEATDAYVWRRLLHSRDELCLEGCRLPGARGV